MKKKKIIILISSLIFLTSIFIVSAAFIFTRVVGGDAKTGEITIKNENYISYALNTNADRSNFTIAEYRAILRERAGATKVDTSLVTNESGSTFSDIVGDISNYYSREVSPIDTFSEGIRYYIKDDTDTYIYQDGLEEFLDGVTYYTITYTSASTYDLDNSYYRLGHQLVTNGITETNYADYFTLSGVDKQGYAIFSKAASYSEDINYFKIVYKPETTTTNSTSTTEGGSIINCINTYATERKINSTESNYIYLNQLGFQFEVSTSIKAYVRIKFYDAWISSKLYPGSASAKENYISKGQISGRSPFYVNNDNWYYDTTNNICYLKATIDTGSHIYSFNINDTYFYLQNTSTVYTENILVQVSYSLELIQANRAKTVWGIDPSTLGSES